MSDEFVCSRRIEAQDAHFDRCREQNVPYVKIRKGWHYADVSLDMWTTDWNLPPEKIERLGQIIRAATLPGGYFWRGPHIFATNKTEACSAEILARHLFKVAVSDEKTRIPLYQENKP